MGGRSVTRPAGPDTDRAKRDDVAGMATATQRTPVSCAVGLHPAADFGEHPHGVQGLSLRDVHDLVAVEHREICRFSKLVNESRQMRASPYAGRPDRPRHHSGITRL